SAFRFCRIHRDAGPWIFRLRTHLRTFALCLSIRNWYPFRSFAQTGTQSEMFSERQLASAARKLPRPRQYASIAETAREFEVSDDVIRKAVADGKIRAIKIGGSWRIPLSEHARLRGEAA